jgi:hypothetical protein
LDWLLPMPVYSFVFAFTDEIRKMRPCGSDKDYVCTECSKNVWYVWRTGLRILLSPTYRVLVNTALLYLKTLESLNEIGDGTLFSF